MILTTRKKKAEQMKINNFLWAHQRTDVTGQIDNPKFERTGKYRESEPRSASSLGVQTATGKNW